MHEEKGGDNSVLLLSDGLSSPEPEVTEEKDSSLKSRGNAPSSAVALYNESGRHRKQQQQKSNKLDVSSPPLPPSTTAKSHRRNTEKSNHHHQQNSQNQHHPQQQQQKSHLSTGTNHHHQQHYLLTKGAEVEGKSPCGGQQTLETQSKLSTKSAKAAADNFDALKSLYNSVQQQLLQSGSGGAAVASKLSLLNACHPQIFGTGNGNFFRLDGSISGGYGNSPGGELPFGGHQLGHQHQHHQNHPNNGHHQEHPSGPCPPPSNLPGNPFTLGPFLNSSKAFLASNIAAVAAAAAAAAAATNPLMLPMMHPSFPFTLNSGPHHQGLATSGGVAGGNVNENGGNRQLTMSQLATQISQQMASDANGLSLMGVANSSLPREFTGSSQHGAAHSVAPKHSLL